ncbi:MAG: HAMP domain-containing histidine kinase [Spirochaetaceae bacterium]|nr:HAMP domain-containing histidine kinase [Spirochaetaceae bacterium]
MFLKKISKSFKKIHFRLAFIFSLIFILSSTVLFTFSFIFIYKSMNNTEEDETKRRLLNYWALFQSEGIDLVMEEIDKESFIYGDRPFFARIADKENKTLFLRYPEVWAAYGIESLEDVPINKFENSLTLKTDKLENFLKAYTVYLSDDYILQMGISTSRSSQLLKLYRRNFIFLLLVLVLLGFGAGLIISGRFLLPIRSLNLTLKDILATGDFSKRIPSEGTRDDLEEAVSLFNILLKRIETLIFQMKGNLDIVAHDLRTPMTIFRGYAEKALNEPENTAAAVEALSSSLEQSEKIISMLNTIMDISEAESGTLKLKKENVDLTQLIKSLVEMYEYVGENKNISISFNSDQCNINADPVRIRQAIANIIDNAVKYSPFNSNIDITIETSANRIILKIKDNGRGIPREDLPFVWDRLFRSHTVQNIPGTGLGLSLVKAVILAHKGSVNVKSDSKTGSEFIISLPK